MTVTTVDFVRDPKVRRYRPRPESRVDAIQWNGDYSSLPDDWKASGAFELDPYGVLLIRTPQGPSRVRLGDYIVRGTASEYYAPPRAVFEARWEVDQ